jgi:hypothetical protein
MMDNWWWMTGDDSGDDSSDDDDDDNGDDDDDDDDDDVEQLGRPRRRSDPSGWQKEQRGRDRARRCSPGGLRASLR